MLVYTGTHDDLRPRPTAAVMRRPGPGRGERDVPACWRRRRSYRLGGFVVNELRHSVTTSTRWVCVCRGGRGVPVLLYSYDTRNIHSTKQKKTKRFERRASAGQEMGHRRLRPQLLLRGAGSPVAAARGQGGAAPAHEAFGPRRRVQFRGEGVRCPTIIFFFSDMCDL